MDPIREGSKIFSELSKEFGPIIEEPERLQAFFERLLEETRGLVILDFLDTANWDCFEKFSFDQKTRVLTVVWHDYADREESDEEAEMRKLAFPGQYYALQMKLRSVEVVSGGNLSVFVVNGYALDERGLKRALQKTADEFRLDRETFFSKAIYRREGTSWQIIRLHGTPISSIAILPKNCGLTSSDSKTLLYFHNLGSCEKRFIAIEEEFLNGSISGDDAVCEKANSTRRILETVLKIECCYRGILPKKEYSHLMLGDLVSMLRESSDEAVLQLLNHLVIGLNEMSHDTGHPVDATRARADNLIALAYAKMLTLEVQADRHGG